MTKELRKQQLTVLRHIHMCVQAASQTDMVSGIHSLNHAHGALLQDQPGGVTYAEGKALFVIPRAHQPNA